MDQKEVNIASRLRQYAELTPDKPAVVLCKGPGEKNSFSATTYTFRQLERNSDAAARGMEKAGIGRGTKTLVMLRPSLPFFSCFFALFKLGAIPVFIDPGMGGKRLLECVRVLAPEAMVGVPLAHLVRKLRPSAFPNFKIAVTVGKRWLWGGVSWDKMLSHNPKPLPLAPTRANDLAAILFTTGSTGPAKGVEYSHGALDRQIELLAETFSITAEDRDCATFPGFSLFSIALGMTAVVPDMNPVRPGSVNPDNIITPATQMGCTFSFGSPALWSRVSADAEKRDVRLPTLKRVVMAGAPVPAAVHQRLLGGILPDDGETYTPYGATEVMPVACIAGSEVLAETAERTAEGKGVCIGRPVADTRVECIRIDDGPIPEWSDSLLLPQGSIGEISVKARHASRHYHNLPQADALAKIADGDEFWHRMGDVGYKDEKGRIWFCGRKAHRVRARGGDLFSIRSEAVFNRHPLVVRSALVGIPGNDSFQRPVIVVETAEKLSKPVQETVVRELRELAAGNNETAGISDFLFHPGFPTDIRHNAKIRREDLALWAEQQLKP